AGVAATSPRSAATSAAAIVCASAAASLIPARSSRIAPPKIAARAPGLNRLCRIGGAPRESS
ncbi:MAG: hypothetical protein ACOY5V_14625, partial [Pseudomonadota bacterium]